MRVVSYVDQYFREDTTMVRWVKISSVAVLAQSLFVSQSPIWRQVSLRRSSFIRLLRSRSLIPQVLVGLHPWPFLLRVATLVPVCTSQAQSTRIAEKTSYTGSHLKGTLNNLQPFPENRALLISNSRRLAVSLVTSYMFPLTTVTGVGGEIKAVPFFE